jgi:hypothetical protein
MRILKKYAVKILAILIAVFMVATGFIYIFQNL